LLKVKDNIAILVGGSILFAIILIALFAPYLHTVDPTFIDTRVRLRPPSSGFWFGTDAFGRDVYSRVVYGTRISLIVGLVVAFVSILIGTIIGVVSGYLRWLDSVIMRVMDGLMAIPGILLAVSLISLSGSSIRTVIIAIAIPEIPRVVRLVRGVVLTVREEPYIEAAIGLGTPDYLILVRHIIPNTFAPLMVQATYTCAAAILLEAILSFLGAGISPEIPTWGNIIAEGRIYFQLLPHIIFFPGFMLSLTVLTVNLFGDGLRDILDPRLANRF
jgi:peptide/nickel transport system permease protein